MANKRVSELVELPATSLKPDDLFLVTDTAVMESKKIKASSIKDYVTNFGSITGSITNATYSETASYIDPDNIGLIESASYAKTSSWSIQSLLADTASYVRWEDIDGVPTYISASETSLTASYLLYQGFPNGQIELANTASYVEFAQTSSYVFYVEGVDNGRVTNADTASYWNFNGTASYIQYSGVPNGTASAALTLLTDEITASYLVLKPGRENGTASHAITSENSIRSLQSETASYLYYNNSPNGTASYAMNAYRSKFSDISTYAYTADTASYSYTSSWSESGSVCISASYAVTASYVNGVVPVATTITDQNVYRMWGPYSTRPLTSGNSSEIGAINTPEESSLVYFSIIPPTGSVTREVTITAMCDIVVSITNSDPRTGKVYLALDNLQSPGTESFELDYTRPMNYINLQTAVSGAASISGYIRQPIVLSGKTGASSDISGSLYRLAVRCENGPLIDISNDNQNIYRGVVFYIYTRPDVVVVHHVT